MELKDSKYLLSWCVNGRLLVHKLTQQPLKLLDGQNRVVLRAVVEVVGHLGHVPRHGPAQRDPDRLAGRSPDGRRPQRAGHGQQRHGEPRGEEHDGAFRDQRGHRSKVQPVQVKSGPGRGFPPLIGAFLLLLWDPLEAGAAVSRTLPPPSFLHLPTSTFLTYSRSSPPFFPYPPPSKTDSF